jgi:uncharacterized protein (TIGR03435 family)
VRLKTGPLLHVAKVIQYPQLRPGGLLMSKRILRSAPIAAFACSLCIAQSESSSHFEVASVKPMGEGRLGSFSGGPGSTDPERITFQATTIEILIRAAYNLLPYQISAPSWLSTERYAVTGILLPGTSQEQLRQMLANLLAERFGLVFHRVMKDFPGYAITVAKGGPKLTPTTHDDNFPVFRSQNDGHGTVHYVLTQTSMTLLTNRISLMLGPGPVTTPIVDHTGISGKFDFTLDVPSALYTLGSARLEPDLEDVATNISDALEREVGLKLEGVKVPLPVLIIDHAERVPTPN